MEEIKKLERPTKEQFFKECLQLTISHDKMSAEILYSIFTEETITKNDFVNYLNSKSIQYGIDEELVERICIEPQEYTGRVMVIAKGTPPINGEDSKIDLRFKDHSLTFTFSNQKQDSIDFKNINNVTNVRSGELLLMKTLPTEGTPGKAVTGEVVKAYPGKNYPLKLGKNVRVDPSGLNVFAALDGQVVITEKEKINVFPVYEVNGDVDYSIGNINFIGAVVIRGNVLSGFSVKAGGDIRVMGEVEAAELEAGGSIQISAGIVAQGKGKIIAGNNVIANFMNQANVIARNDVLISQSIMHSQVRADHAVVCNNGKGLIVGGRIQAGEKIEAKIVGNTVSTPTILEVGIAPEIVNEFNEIKHNIQDLYVNLETTNKGIAVLNNQLATQRIPAPDKQALRLKLLDYKMTLEKNISELEARKNEIEQSLDLAHQARIDIREIAYPGTKLTFGKYTRYLKQENSRVSFRLEEGEINSVPL